MLLFLLVLAVFFPALRNDFINYDDNGYVTANAWVQNGLSAANLGHAFRTTEIAYWHPLTWVSHLADVEFFGRKAWGHHLTSVLLHALNALLVFVVLRKLTGEVGRSWMVAALFGLHPLHVESVAWVAERKDVLSTFFLLVAVWCYAQWIRQRVGQRPRAALAYWGSLLGFAAGLMSKPMVVTLPGLLLVLDFWPLNRWERRPDGTASGSLGRLFVEKIPFFVLAVAAGAVTVWAQSALGTLQSMEKYSWATRLANALVSYVRYLEKCFYPSGLAVFYPYPAQQPVALVIFAVILLTGITAAVVVGRKKKPYLLMGWLWFLGTLVPVIGFVQVGGQAMADRYSYVPLIGIFVAAVWGAADLFKNMPDRRTGRAIASGAVLVACATLTVRQLGYWRNSLTLFRHALAVTENNWTAHFCLGYFYAQSPATAAEAIAEYRTTLEIAPRFAEAHFSLGAMLARKPDTLAEAVSEYQAALRLNPRYFDAQYALTKALAQMPGRLADAIAAGEAAVRLAPDNSDAHNDLADLLAQVPENGEEAVAEYRAVLRLRPDLVEIHNNIGLVLASQPGRLPEAIAEYETALRAKPDFAEAHLNLANALARTPDRQAETIAEYEAALRLKPDYFEAEFNLGLFLSSLPGRSPEAIAHFEVALRIKPDLEAARVMIRRLQFGAGQ